MVQFLVNVKESLTIPVICSVQKIFPDKTHDQDCQQTVSSLSANIQDIVNNGFF